MGVRERCGGLLALGGPLEPAVLVEQPWVHCEDALADDVKAEVPGLDDPGVDRADSDLVDAVAGDRCHPQLGVLGMGCERAQRRVSRELQAVEVVGLALIPSGGLHEIDRRFDLAGCRCARDHAVFVR